MPTRDESICVVDDALEMSAIRQRLRLKPYHLTSHRPSASHGSFQVAQ